MLKNLAIKDSSRSRDTKPEHLKTCNDEVITDYMNDYSIREPVEASSQFQSQLVSRNKVTQ